ncbi:MAG: carboxypeptidase regulatory-like domain-containing protein [Bacillota bacterium]|nr:carboxypeptidase regulatory-like domain-containing protein [Bacillota bacterium]
MRVQKRSWFYLGGAALLAGLLLSAALLVLPPFLGLGSLYGRPAGGSLAGQVTAVKGIIPFALPGLPGVRVTVQPGGYTATTDRNGFFSLDVPPGVYEVTFSAPGYETLLQKVLVPASSPARVSAALFPAPQGRPVAALKWGARSQGEGRVPYNTAVYLDASDSQNVSREGIRWEIRDGAGRILNDPYAVPPRPLQLAPSPIPGSSPLEFIFTPPAPGIYTVRLFLKNRFSGEEESSAELVVQAENTPPEALPRVIAGPHPPGKQPDGRLKEGSGLRTVLAGEKVYLAGWGLDRNLPSPELYNPGGHRPDAYGKNDDWLQRQFAWHWRLEYVDPAGKRTDVTRLLQADGPEPAQRTQYPWFVAERPGQYIATLAVEDRDPYGPSLLSPEASLTIAVLPREGALAPEKTCLQGGCHRSLEAQRPSPSDFPAAGTGRAGQVAGGMSCQACHGPGQPHLSAQGAEAKRQTMEVSYEAAQCGRCHQEYSQWEKSRHADGYAYGFYEVARPLLLNCAKCHYPQGFADAVSIAAARKIPFGEVEFKKPLFPGGPLFFDFDRVPEKVGRGISCQACHDPHRISPENKEGLRVDKSALCATCHEEKWQNVLLEGTAGRVGSAYEYPGEKYDFPNPHNTPEKCVLCHMDQGSPAVDEQGVRRLGGHTLRMRDAGPDGKLGGFGPSPDDPNRPREQYGADDLLNTAPCQRCHPGATTFDLNGRQREIYNLWLELGRLLRERNQGTLPGYKPGDKCATCHRGGTMPFNDDPYLVLENAYTNYKLVMNDRSWGIHNYRYTKKLLEDSIRSLKEGMAGR